VEPPDAEVVAAAFAVLDELEPPQALSPRQASRRISAAAVAELRGEMVM
jgi:hypothetical protein